MKADRVRTKTWKAANKLFSQYESLGFSDVWTILRSPKVETQAIRKVNGALRHDCGYLIGLYRATSKLRIAMLNREPVHSKNSQGSSM